MQISAKVIQHSKSIAGVEIVTMELVYPRFIHSEFMTHRVFSRNAASSRAIPIEKMLEQVSTDPAMPVHWGANQPGMQADNQVEDVGKARDLWSGAALLATHAARQMSDIGLHKQVVNRILEPYQWMKTIVTATEWDNFFELRCHKDAQPEIQELAMQIEDALCESSPMLLEEAGEWHVPYVDRHRNPSGDLGYFTGDIEVTHEQALKISASCCAQVSYRKLDDGLDKARVIYDRLIGSKPAHASPFEHQASPLAFGRTYSGNFRGWRQYRKLLKL